MRHFIKIFVLVCFSLGITVYAGNSPVPPEVKSEIGYLIVEEDVSISPNFERFLLLPHVELLVLSEDIDSFHLVYIDQSSSFSCTIPKYAKNMVLLRDTKRDNFISFRGPLEVKTSPIEYKREKSFPLRKKIRITVLFRSNEKGFYFL